MWDGVLLSRCASGVPACCMTPIDMRTHEYAAAPPKKYIIDIVSPVNGDIDTFKVDRRSSLESGSTLFSGFVCAITHTRCSEPLTCAGSARSGPKE